MQDLGNNFEELSQPRDEEPAGVLKAASIEELYQLRDIVLAPRKWSTDIVIKNGWLDDPEVLGWALAEEIRKFGGNTFANFFRLAGDGPPWAEVVKDAAKHYKVYPERLKGASVEEMEFAMFEKYAGAVWANMSEAERQTLMAECGVIDEGGKAWMSGGSSVAFQAAFRAGGFTSYKMLMIIVNGMVEYLIKAGLIKTGLSLATNALITKTAAIFTGPIGLATTGLLTGIQIAGPSYRVTRPCVIYVHCLRRKQLMEPRLLENEAN